MSVRISRWLLVTALLMAVVGCSPSAAPSSPMSASAPASKRGMDYVALEAEIEKAITTGPVTLDKVRAVLVSVDGETKIAHYRHGFTEDDHGHVFSVTKSVLSILIGIAIADGLIADIDEPLSTLLPKHREAMSGDTSKVTLRHLMSMSGGFNNEFPGGFVWEEYAKPDRSFVNVLLERRQDFEPGKAFGTPMSVLTSWRRCSRLPWNGPTATVLGRFWTTPGRSSSIRWASRPTRPSPRHCPIRLSRLNL